MRFFIPLLALAGLATAKTEAAGVTDKIAPPGSAPDTCSPTWQGTFEIAVVKPGNAKRDLELQKRAACGGDETLVMTLSNGILTDAANRIGYIASNRQFQFDGPPQAGAIYTAGFSVCANGSLALGASTVWYRCLSGSFYNLYDRLWARQCEQISLRVLPCGAGAAAVSALAEAPGSTVAASTVVTVVSGGEVRAVPTQVPVPVCQIADGQIQAHDTPCGVIHVPPVTLAVPSAPGTTSVLATVVPVPPASSTVQPPQPSETPNNNNEIPPAAAGSLAVPAYMMGFVVGVVMLMMG